MIEARVHEYGNLHQASQIAADTDSKDPIVSRSGLGGARHRVTRRG